MALDNRAAITKIPGVPLQPEATGHRSGYPANTARLSPPDDGSLAKYLGILVRHKAILSITVIAGGVLAYALTRIQTPTYRASTSIEIESLNQDFLNIRSVIPTSSGQPLESPEYNLRTQSIVLQSTPLVERALSKLDLENRLEKAQQQRRKLPWGTLTNQSEDTPETRHSNALTSAANALKVRIEPNTRVVEVSYDSTDPQLAADMANSIARAFGELSLERRTKDSQSTREWLSAQLQDLRSKLEKAESTALDYARTENLGVVSEKNNVAEDQLRQIQQEITKAQADRIFKQSRNELASSASTEALSEVLDDPALKDYQGQLTTLRRQMAELSSTYTATHPKMLKVKAEIATVEAALVRSRANILGRIKSDYDAAARREALLSADYARQMQAITNQSDKVTRYLLLRHEADTTRQLYDSLVQRVTEAGLASAMRTSDIHVIQPASRPSAPFKPNSLLNTTFGLFSGLCFGVALVIFRARSERGIDKPGEASLHLNVPELGVIPTGAIDSSGILKLLKRSVPSEALELTTWQRWSSAMAESFRLTLVSILRSDVNDGRRPVLAISSATAGEGKTTVLSNLGIALAQIDCRVLLVDGDMRKPRLHKIFHVDNSIGLSDALSGNDFVTGHKTSIPKLFVLPSGPQPDERLLFSSRLEKVLSRLKDQYDIILVDTPPLLQLSDARLIAIHTDAVILVVAQYTDREAVYLAKQRLAEDGSHLLGAILNNWDPRKADNLGRLYYQTSGKNGNGSAGVKQ